MPKTLITHINPHLDDIAAIWQFIKFHPDFKDAKVEFVSQSKTDKLSGQETEDRVFFGIGKGRFDEHKGNIGDCATSLVWKDIKLKNLAPKDSFKLAAFEELVEWVRLVDTATFPKFPYLEFSVQAFIRPLSGSKEESIEAVELGEKILDRILQILVNKQKVKKAWENHIEFQTRFGRTAAVESEDVTRANLDFLTDDAFALFLIRNPHSRHVQFFSPRQDVDLTPIYMKVTQLDPDASWYLHHAKRMILCGSGSVSDFKPTKLSFEKLIEVVKSI